MNKKKIDLSNFDFNDFKTEALSQLKSGQSLTGKDGILTPRCYNFANIEHSTRYRYHKYYNDADQEHGLNQEG